MTGAEQDRREAATVDQDRKADEMTDKAHGTNTLHRLHAEQDQSPWIDFIDRDLLKSGKLEQMVAGRHPRPDEQPDHLRQGGRHRAVRRAGPPRDRGRQRRPPDLRGDRHRPMSATRPTSCARSTTSRTGPMASPASRSSLSSPRTATPRWPGHGSCGRAWTDRTCSSRSRPPWQASPPSRAPSPRASTST